MLKITVEVNKRKKTITLNSVAEEVFTKQILPNIKDSENIKQEDILSQITVSLLNEFFKNNMKIS